MSKRNYKGERNPNWKGGIAKYQTIHNYIKSIKPKKTNCEICGSDKQIELSNKDHQYSLNPNDYMYLCNSCHQKHDYENRLKEAGNYKNIKKELKKAIIQNLTRKEVSNKVGIHIRTLVKKIREYWGEEGIKNITDARKRWL